MQYYEKSLKMQQHEWIIINFPDFVNAYPKTPQ